MSELLGGYLEDGRVIKILDDFSDFELSEIFVMLKNHLMVLTIDGVVYIGNHYNYEYIIDIADKTDFYDNNDELAQYMFAHSVIDLDEVNVINHNSIRALLQGFLLENDLYNNEYFLSEGPLKLNPSEILDYLSDAKAALDRNELDKDEFTYFMGKMVLELLVLDDNPLEYGIIDIFRCFTYFDTLSLEERLSCTITDINYYLEDIDKPMHEKRLPDFVRVRYIKALDFYSYRRSITEKEKDTFVNFVNSLLKSKDLEAYRWLAYEFYNGSKLIKKDYKTSEAILLNLLDRDYQATYANTLGYIYYYGRTTDNEPDYPKAFQYFSMAALSGDIQAAYKLGDFYKNGYYVKQNYDAALKIYAEKLDAVLKEFSDDPEHSCLPDLYFRVADLLSKSTNRNDILYTVELYLSALCACNYEADPYYEKLAKSITKDLLIHYDKYKDEIDTVNTLYSSLRKFDECKLSVESSEKGNIVITFQNKHKAFVCDFLNKNCEYTDEVSLHFDGEMLEPIDEDIIFEEIKDDFDGNICFYRDDELIGKISKSNVIVLFEDKLIEDTNKSFQEYNVAVCQYKKGKGRKYTFLYDSEPDINKFWYIVETEQEIFPIEFKTIKEYELPCDLKVMKHIKSKENIENE